MKATIPYLYCECGVAVTQLGSKDMLSCSNRDCQHFGKEFIRPFIELKPVIREQKKPKHANR